MNFNNERFVQAIHVIWIACTIYFVRFTFSGVKLNPTKFYTVDFYTVDFYTVDI